MTKSLNTEEVLKNQNTNLSTGLTTAEAKQRIEKYGLNEIPEN